MEKALVKLKGFLLYCEVFNLCRSFLKGVLLYTKVCKLLPVTLQTPFESSANFTAMHEMPRLRVGWIVGTEY